jgi:hypothetical protein
VSQPLRPADLAGADGLEPAAPEIAEALSTARELDASLAAADVHPSATFADRVMEAIVAEPLPHPAIAVGLAARRGRIGALVGALADTWRVAMSGGRPFAVRAQAAAFVIVAVLAITSLGAIAAGGALQMLGPVSTGSGEPGSSTSPVPTASPAPTASPEPSTSPQPTDSLEPSASPPSTGTPVHTATPTAAPTQTPHPSHTPEPTVTPEPTGTPNPTETARET